MTPKQEKLLLNLLEKPTIKEAAEIAGISESTALRYLKDEDFKIIYRDARREFVNHSITKLQSSSKAAAQTLCDICEDESAPVSSRINAAKLILDLALRSVEIDDLAARVELLEERTETLKNAKI